MRCVIAPWALAGTVALFGASLFVACGGNDSDPATPAATAATASPTPSVMATPEPGPTATRSIEEEVREAYLAYWDAYAAALLNLDLSLVADFAMGDELELIREEIEALRADGLAARIVVEHTIGTVQVTERTAIVVDRIISNSFRVDAVTKDPPEAQGSGEVLNDTFFLEEIDGRWIVVRSSRQR